MKIWFLLRWQPYSDEKQREKKVMKQGVDGKQWYFMLIDFLIKSKKRASVKVSQIKWRLENWPEQKKIKAIWKLYNCKVGFYSFFIASKVNFMDDGSIVCRGF